MTQNDGNQTQRPQSLASQLSINLSGKADHVLIGLNWTAVVGPFGVGLAHSPTRGTSSCNGPPVPGSYAGQKLAELANLTNSENVFEKSIGYAAINAFHNRFDLEGNDTNGLDLIQDFGKQTVVVGQFPGLATRVPNAAVIERDSRMGCYPESAAADLLPNAKHVLITASALTNGSLSDLLSFTKDAHIVLVGPSAPLSPTLFDWGVNAICGFVAKNTEALLRTVMEGGAVAAMRPHGRFLTLERQ